MPECATCQTPLGHETSLLGYSLCHEHRRCVVCRFSVTPQEAAYCLDKGLDIRHYRCIVLVADKDGRQTIDMDLINRVTLLISDPMLTEQMLVNMISFDQRYLFLQAVQAVAANTSILLRKDKQHFEARLRQEELDERHEKEANKKRNPVKEAAAVGVKTTSEKVARHHLSLRDKAINGMVKLLGISREEAEKAQALVDAKRSSNQLIK